ncbi:hypothetical protein Ancab_030181 [Ancistrocladus abbreviatus]
MAATPKSSVCSTLPLKDRVAIVTGSSHGIGRGVALHLASLGAKEVVQQINSSWSAAFSTPRAVVIQADVTNPEQVTALFDAAEKAFHDEVHILVACAGMMDTTLPTIANTSVESFDKVLNLSTKGTFICVRETANRLKRGGGGRIITFSGTCPHGFQPGFAVYYASMRATEAMTNFLAKELKGKKITANCVVPGATWAENYPKIPEANEFIELCVNVSPLLRLGEPHDVAALIGFLVSDDGEWVTGQVIGVDGGFSY